MRLSRDFWSRPSQTDTTRSSGQISVFSGKPELWNSSCVHPQAGPDSSEPDICGALVSYLVSLFQPVVPGAIVSGSFMRDPVFATRSSRRPGQDILRECFTGPVQDGFQARRVPRWLVLITSGPEDQESGQSSQSEQWSPGQDSLLVNRIFRGSPSTFVRLFTTDALCCSGLREPRTDEVLSPRTRMLKYQPWSSSGQPRKLPCSSLWPAA